MTRQPQAGWRGVVATVESGCPLCPHPIRRGDPIAKHRGQWAHRRCIETRHGE